MEHLVNTPIFFCTESHNETNSPASRLSKNTLGNTFLQREQRTSVEKYGKLKKTKKTINIYVVFIKEIDPCERWYKIG